ncbi:GDSL esterase/lipase At5g03610-like [Telopea speciosissima]|uniref:GDSL esterase/lipase At5g03610-like n=1 Tax=Telopea speciosissima TaxID=54955 RepID=UPI001CC66697|nr:GDSL esterase/lipase At5g03610-like [Telopea speciosissima]
MEKDGEEINEIRSELHLWRNRRFQNAGLRAKHDHPDPPLATFDSPRPSLYTGCIASSVALVSLAGNDYGAYNARNGSAQGLRAFIASVVNQLALNLKRIHDMGVKKIAVIALEPLGCLA